MVPLFNRRGRAAAIAGVTAGAVALGAALGPVAFADPVTEVHDFAVDDGNWFSYPPGAVTSGVVEGELCAEVAAHTGNPWDVALQHDGVEYADGTTYTVSLDLRASRAVSLPLRGGIGYPNDFSQTIPVTTTTENVSFTFTPEGWGGTGNTSFQLGNQGEAYTLCIDNFSIVPVQNNLIPNGDFASGTLDPWFAAAALGTPDLSSGALVLDVTGGSQYDGVGYNGVPIVAGKNYVLTFDASASAAKDIRVLVGQSGAPWGTVLDQGSLAIGPETATYSFPFQASASYPAVSAEDGSDPAGQLAFQIGGRGTGWRFTLDNVSLVETATPPPPYAPETFSPVRVNQVGYLPVGPKNATLVTDATDALAWELRNAETRVVVESGTTSPAGVDPTAGVNVHEIDFSSFTTPGTYVLTVGEETSFDFVIGADIYDQLRYDALDYYYPVRSGIAIDGSIIGDPRYTRPAGHVENPDSSLVAESPNQGDYGVECLTDAVETGPYSYGDWTCNYTRDVVGGWYDAGDHGKYVVNGGISVAQLLQTYERQMYAPTADGDLSDGTLDIPTDESSNGVPDVLDEARWELEWMMRMQVPADATMYPNMVHHKIHDMEWTGLPLLPHLDEQERYLHRPSTAATLNFAAVAAHGARLWAEYDPAFAEDLLEAGFAAWDAALANPEVYAPADMGGNGGGPYNDDNVGDEFYWAAAELFLTTGADEFEDFLLSSPYHTQDIWTPAGITWGDTAGLGRIDLAVVESDFVDREAVRLSVIAGAEKYLAWQQGQPFGTAYPGENGGYSWGSNSMVLNNQIVLATAFDLTSDQRFADAVIESMDYLLGRNALNESYITGYGDNYAQNQHSRWYAADHDTLPPVPTGAISGGPNSNTATWDDVIKGLYNPEHMCAPQLCHIDDIQSWSTNEITVNWNAPLSFVASFLADQHAGDQAAAGEVVWVVEHPADVSVVEGDEFVFTAAATSDPAAEVQWEFYDAESDLWLPIDGANEATFSDVADMDDNGAFVRAYFWNAFGGFYTDAAQLTVLAAAAPTVTLSDSEVEAGGTTTVTVTGFGANVVVTIWLGEELLGELTTDVDGNGSVTVTIPAGTAAGAYELVAAGGGVEAAAALTVVAAEVPPTTPPTTGGGGAGGGGALPDTGADVGWLLGLALALILGGTATVAGVRVLRTRPPEPTGTL